MRRAFPRCFDTRRQYELWVEAAHRSSLGRNSYCTDCTAEHQRRMGAQRRCGHPATAFHVDDDGFAEGRRPVEDRVRHGEVA